MNKTPFSLHRRGSFWYVQFRGEDGKYTAARSTRQRSKGAATAWAVEYLKSGRVAVTEKATLRAFAAGFFDYPKGPFAKSRLDFNFRISAAQCRNHKLIYKNHLDEPLGDLRLSAIDETQILRLTQKLKTRRSPGTINHVLETLKILLEAAYEKRLIQRIPAIRRLGTQGAKKRDSFTPGEVALRLREKWVDDRSFAAFALAVSTGLRISECLALQFENVSADHIDVIYGYDWVAGKLKETKTGTIRRVPIAGRVYELLDALMKSSPYEKGFVFYSDTPGRPFARGLVLRHFRLAMEAAGIDTAGRNIVFHSTRHFFNSYLLNAGVPKIQVQGVMGHCTEAMTLNYYHPGEAKEIRALQDGLIGNS